VTLPHENATAKITIDGLALCCFNQAGRKWEIGYLHLNSQPQHDLILQIEDETPIDIPATIREITFTAVNPQTPSFPGSARGFFDPIGRRPDRHIFPTTADELENFRWIIDLQDPRDTGHGNANGRRAPFPVTRAFLHEAVLYTSRLSSREVFRIPFTGRPEHNPNQMDEPTRQGFRFGLTNDETAADIFCAPTNGAVRIEIPGVLPQPRVLPHRPGNPWKICLTNLCFRAIPSTIFDIGDFQLFYEVLTVTGQKQAIWGQPVVGQETTCSQILVPNRLGGPILSGRVDCDITWMGASETLDPIIP
jgi:hypothetical protein